MVELLGSSVQIEGAVKCFQDLTAALNLHKKKAMLAQQAKLAQQAAASGLSMGGPGGMGLTLPMPHIRQQQQQVMTSPHPTPPS